MHYYCDKLRGTPGGLRQADVTEETELGQTLSAWAAEESWDVTKTALIAPGI